MSDTVAPQEGKFYRTRDGRKVGPAKKQYEGRFEFIGPHSHCHGPDGRYLGRDMGLDLVAEWVEGPVVTATVKRVVPGKYGIVSVSQASDTEVILNVGGLGMAFQQPAFTARQLREAAHTLTIIADALQES